MLYQNLINKDRDAIRERQRSSIEYAMAFLKPEVLEKVVRQRKSEQEIKDNEEVFEKQISDMFGKPLQSSG